jgi:hypothetical protein
VHTTYIELDKRMGMEKMGGYTHGWLVDGWRDGDFDC